MKVSEAQTIIDEHYELGLITAEEAQRHSKMIRRTGDYGNTWSWSRQAERRESHINQYFGQ